jgi:hypothetical protein
MLRPAAASVRATFPNVRAAHGTEVRVAHGIAKREARLPPRRASSGRMAAVPRSGAVILILLPECER